MAKKIINKQKDQAGFSLMEVMLAITLFTIFGAAVYVTVIGKSQSDSMLIEEEIFLKRLCLNVLNELIINPPELRDSLTLVPEEKTIEKYPNYKYTIEYKKLELPDLSKLLGEEDQPESEQSPGIQKDLANKVKDNMEKLIWQIRVTITNKETNYFYTVSRWLYNDQAQLDLNF